MHLLYCSNNFWKATWKSSCVSGPKTFVSASFISPIVSWRLPLSLDNNQKSLGKGLDFGRVRNCLDAHLGQIVCDKGGVVDWCIVLVEMPLTRFEECWPLPRESLPELHQKLKNWCSIHAWCSKSSLKHSIHFCGIFSKFKTEFYCISFF